MHSSILSQVLNSVFSWITNFEYNWDNGSFTILDYITFCCIIFCIFYFVWHIIFFLIRLYERNWLGD